jgi:DNA-binding transcriptional ArsR family regulator
MVVTMDTSPDKTTHLDGAQVRALAHPIRARLLALLRVGGPSTSTRLAEQLGTNSGATSYHLRQLAAVGLVTEDDSLGTKRDRWWRASHTQHSWRDTDHDEDPDTRAAADWLIRYAHRAYTRQVEDWHDARPDWPIEWRDAADQSDFLITVTASQLADLNRRVAELMAEYQGTTAPAADAEPVTVLYYTFPRRAVRL